jgi:hypothetical protein
MELADIGVNTQTVPDRRIGLGIVIFMYRNKALLKGSGCEG